MTTPKQHRLDGLEPDNLLAFLALLGLLRTLDHVRPHWLPRIFWTVDQPPTRPVLRLSKTVEVKTLVAATTEGLNQLAVRHDFEGRKDLTLPPKEATRFLHDVIDGDRYQSDLWAALLSDVAIARDGKKAEPTPLCLMFGQGHQHFLARLSSVPKQKAPPKRGSGRNKVEISEERCLHEALFESWRRPDATSSFRWDPQEDVRYALRSTDPTDAKTKETTQHGANRLAAVGISTLTVVPQRRGSETRLGVLGGRRERSGEFVLTWPIWRDPIGLAAIRALLGHPDIESPGKLAPLGVVECRRARRISSGKFMNFTRAESI